MSLANCSRVTNQVPSDLPACRVDLVTLAPIMIVCRRRRLLWSCLSGSRCWRLRSLNATRGSRCWSGRTRSCVAGWAEPAQLQPATFGGRAGQACAEVVAAAVGAEARWAAGARGTTLRQVEKPDVVVRHEPRAGWSCGDGLVGAVDLTLTRRQVFEVPPVATRVTERRMVTRRCDCGHETTAASPAQVDATVQYGPRLTAIVVYLIVAQFGAQKRVAQAVADLFGVPISQGSVAAMTTRAAKRFEGDFLTQLRQRLARETGALRRDRVPGCWQAALGSERVRAYTPEPGAEGLQLTKPDANTYRITDTDGTISDFTMQGAAWTLASSRSPESSSTTRYVYDTSNARALLTKVINPVEPGVDDANSCTAATLPAGCEVLEYVYATATTSGLSQTVFGDYVDHVKQVKLWASDPSTGTVSATVVTEYRYDVDGELREVWDPRMSGPDLALGKTATSSTACNANEGPEMLGVTPDEHGRGPSRHSR